VVIFRDAKREDLPAIVALLADDLLGAGRETAQVDEVYWVAFDQIQSDPRSRLIVADANGETANGETPNGEANADAHVAGTLQLNLVPGLSRHGMLRAQIEGVRIAAPHRGQGLGRTMIEWAIGQAREQGCGLVQLTSDKRRLDAVRFYESLGFTASHEGLKLSL
jgi:GNAT superfamily N-acetyltransferase